MIAFDQITPQHLIFAWSIPGLTEDCRKLENKEKKAEIVLVLFPLCGWESFFKILNISFPIKSLAEYLN